MRMEIELRNEMVISFFQVRIYAFTSKAQLYHTYQIQWQKKGKNVSESTTAGVHSYNIMYYYAKFSIMKSASENRMSSSLLLWVKWTKSIGET